MRGGRIRGAAEAGREAPKTSSGRGSIPRGSIVFALLLLLSAIPARGQQALVEIRFPQLGRQQLVRASHDEEGQLVLPTDALIEITGEDLPGQHLSLGQLRHALGPGVEVDYRPRRAVVVIRDPHRQLAATRAQRQRRRNEARARGRLPQHGQRGPWAVLVADGRGEARARAGVQVGRLSAFGSHGTVGAPTWGGSLRLFGSAYLGYQDGSERRPSLTLRAAPGPLFVSGRVDPTDPGSWSGRAAVSHGRVTVFGTSRGTGAVTWDPPGSWTITAGFGSGDNWEDRSLIRVGFGRSLSHLSIPSLPN